MIGRLGYWIAVALLTAGCTHLAAILALPSHDPNTAFGRLSSAAEGVVLQSIALPDAAGLTPFADPAQVTAFCLYDLRDGPVAVSLEVPDPALAGLAVHTRHGRVLYGLAGHPGAPHRLDLELMTGEQAAHRPAGPITAATPIRVQTEEPQGFVLGQVLADTPSETQAAKAAVRSLSCRATAG